MRSKMKVIRIPDTIKKEERARGGMCFEQNKFMVRCTLPYKHKGKHSWERQ